MSDQVVMTAELREELEALEQAQEGFPEDFQDRALSVVGAFQRARLCPPEDGNARLERITAPGQDIATEGEKKLEPERFATWWSWLERKRKGPGNE